MCQLNNWPTGQNEGDTKSASNTLNKTKANQEKPENTDYYAKKHKFTILNTKTDYYKYTLSKQLEELDTSKRYNGKYLYYIKQIVFLFHRNNKIIVPLKIFIKKEFN